MSTEFVTEAQTDLEQAKQQTARFCEYSKCGKEFVPAKHNQKCCTPACRLKKHREEGDTDRRREMAQEGELRKEVASASVAAERLHRLRDAGEWGALSRWGGGPRECHCNGSHLPYMDDDGDPACHKCGGLLGGPTIYAYIAREKRSGRSCEGIAECLRRWGAPLSLDGFSSRESWTAKAVQKVLLDGCYLPPDRQRRQRGNVRTSPARWVGGIEAPEHDASNSNGLGAVAAKRHDRRVFGESRERAPRQEPNCLVDPTVREYTVEPGETPLNLPAPGLPEARYALGREEAKA